MNYNALILETDAELEKLEKQQRLVQFQQRIRFLRALKQGPAQTQAQAGEQVGWKLRYSQQMWQRYRTSGIVQMLEQPRRSRLAKLSSQQMLGCNSICGNSE